MSTFAAHILDATRAAGRLISAPGPIDLGRVDELRATARALAGRNPRAAQVCSDLDPTATWHPNVFPPNANQPARDPVAAEPERLFENAARG